MSSYYNSKLKKKLVFVFIKYIEIFSIVQILDGIKLVRMEKKTTIRNYPKISKK